MGQESKNYKLFLTDDEAEQLQGTADRMGVSMTKLVLLILSDYLKHPERMKFKPNGD